MFSRTFVESVDPEVLNAVGRAMERVQLQEAQAHALASPSGPMAISNDDDPLSQMQKAALHFGSAAGQFAKQEVRKTGKNLKTTRYGKSAAVGTALGTGIGAALAAKGIEIPGSHAASDYLASIPGRLHGAYHGARQALGLEHGSLADMGRADRDALAMYRGNDTADLRRSQDNSSLAQAMGDATRGRRQAMQQIAQLRHGNNAGDLQLQQMHLTPSTPTLNSLDTDGSENERMAGYAQAGGLGLAGLAGSAAAVRALRARRKK